MLPTIRGLTDRDDGDGDPRRDWRYAGLPRPSSFTYGDETRSTAAPAPGPVMAPLPPLRSTLSFREDDAWKQRGPPAPAVRASASSHPAQHARPPLDLFAHLPLSSSASSSGSVSGGFRGADARMHVAGHGSGVAMEEDDDDDRYYASSAAAHGYDAPAHHQHHQQQHSHTSARQDHHDAVFHSKTNNGASPNVGSAEATAAAKRRSRRMSNSERGKLYRSRRKDYVQTLEEQVEALKQQLEDMRAKGNGSASNSPNPTRPASPYDSLALSRDRSRAGLSRIVCEYFSLFQFGVPVGSDGLPQSPSQQQLQVAQSPRLLSFLQTLVDPNMRFGNNFGVQMLLEQWQRYSAYHGSLQFQLNSLEVVSDAASPLISATATLRVRFTRTTIEKVFPHVLWNEALVQRLVGREIEYPVGNKFYFGPDGKIKRYETEVDFVTAFVEELGNLHDAMQVVGNAMIKDGRIIDDDGHDTAAHASLGASGESRSPTGSQGSAASSRGSVHSQTHSPPLQSSAEPPRPGVDRPLRFKQSDEPRAESEEDAYGDHGMASRFARLNNNTPKYYDGSAAGHRPYAREPPPYPHHHQAAYAARDGHHHQHEHHHHHDDYQGPRQSYGQGHFNQAADRDAMAPNGDRRREGFK